ncbi:DMT family transporter [Acinetobacter boissieri]|uniref:Permease of the drug/metabolite transporter (DMT) superfamily n=1 Tax=Acinetobacter boissieri TaxID=1219383 RepID=A0A1G6HHZ1_9GAMM|nr:DMT family transporter [Acinetobacter boissieri]SDB93821.1 Permease of the drug/metabolite transporter (DMT) superfamily [Acinetobacter boissieri]
MKLNLFLYALIVVLWGTTWSAITLQQSSHIAPEVAVFWRFFISAMILLLGLILTKKLAQLSFQDHLWCALQGCLIFGFNFFCFYQAVNYINSGLEAVIFSMAVLFNTLNSKLFFKQPIRLRFYPAVVFGFLGMIALFWHDLQGTYFKLDTLKGIVLCLVGTYGFSLGNMLSLYHQKKGNPILTTTAYAMSYGMLVMLFLSLIQGHDLFPTLTAVSLLSIVYLAVFGSVIGFCAYFFLIGRIGAGNAAYSTLIFPLIALLLATYFEGYTWHSNAVIGIICILIGNAIFFIPFERIWRYMKQHA